MILLQEQLSCRACIRQGSSNRNLNAWAWRRGGGGGGEGRLLDKRLLFKWSSIRSFMVFNIILAAHCTLCAFRFI